MWIGSLALMGFPIFAGYYSKDMVLEVAWAAHSGVGNYAFVMGLVAAFMTAFYSGRLLFMTFHGETRADHHTFDHAHDAPKIMWVPLLVLAGGAVLSGMLFYDYFVGEHFESFWREAIFLSEENEVIEHAHHAPAWVKFSPLVVGLLGLGLSWVMYIARPAVAGALAQTFRPLYLFLLNKWYFDELYDFIFVRPSKAIGRFLWKEGDGRVIDGFGPNRAASFVVAISKRAKAIQTGYVYHYAFAIVVGVALIVTWYMIYGGSR
jgi:NADH-quinone oxidoreductase subunit L